MNVLCNTRILGAELTGVQRYLSELLLRLPSVETLDAPSWARGPMGHAWEQFALPSRLGRQKLLWSPSNVGPLAVRRQIVTLHDLATFEFPEGFSSGFQAFYTWLLPRLLPKVDAIITVSEYTRSRALARFDLDPDRVRTIPLGIDHARFSPRPTDEIEAFRRREKLPARYILFLGSLSTRKNIRGLLDAWRIAQQSLAGDVQLVVAGGAGQAQFKGNSIIDLPPRTLPIGRVSETDLPLLLGGAALFAFPSLYEASACRRSRPWPAARPPWSAISPRCRKSPAPPPSSSIRSTSNRSPKACASSIARTSFATSLYGVAPGPSNSTGGSPRAGRWTVLEEFS